MAMIDKDEIMLDEIQTTLQLSDSSRTKMLDEKKSPYLGNLHDVAIHKFYDVADDKYEHLYNMLRLVQEEYSSHEAVEQFKWANELEYGDLTKHYLQYLSKDLLGKILDDDEIRNADIKQYNNNLIDIDMTDEEIQDKINKAMLGQSRKYLEQNHPDYDLTDEDEIKLLYETLYTELSSKWLQLTVDMEELHNVSRYIDLWNITNQRNNNNADLKYEEEND